MTRKNYEEIADIINSPLDSKYETILKNSKDILTEHIHVDWF